MRHPSLYHRWSTASFEPGGAPSFPKAASPRSAAIGISDWIQAIAAGGDEAAKEKVQFALADPVATALLEAIFGNSPHLTHLASRDPAFLLEILSDGPELAVNTALREVTAVRRRAIEGTEPGAALRILKRRIALATAIADIADVWSEMQVTATLSEFAAGALSAICSWLLGDSARRGILNVADQADPERHSGLIVLGMGKLGGWELNYSSDVDLIILYDAGRLAPAGCEDIQRRMDRFTRAMVRLMADRTTDGYVFRVDLRLRPDPGSMPPAVSLAAAEEYYESLGQNWERAAFIKARPVAGDLDAGFAFLKHLRPFIWRRNLDFAAIQDIHSIKRQINAHRGGGRIALAGHNVKLGRGGIREIEFFAQTQQLIWGGREPLVRANSTVGALDALAQAGKISDDVAGVLKQAYWWLRRVEHRLQMTNDEQTHSLPADSQHLEALALFLGYDSVEDFGEAMLATLRSVESYYAELFEDSPQLSLDATGGNLVFTGGEPDPETLATIAGLGFKQADVVDQAIRGWHHGRYQAMRSTRARELLTELTPQLLDLLAQQPDPDAAFLTFDRFLKALPTGVPLFSLFHAHPDLMALVSEILGAAPALGGQLARTPALLDNVLASDFFLTLPPLASLAEELARTVDRATDTEDVLDRSRRWANDRKFQVGVQSIKGWLDPAQSGQAWSNIADAAIQVILPRMEAEFAETHGHLVDGSLAVLGMGKLGGREMTATSDLDLIFVYASVSFEAVSDGPRPLSTPQYYARLSQRLINALSAPTAEGRLYEVDMRLRPSGKAGPIAASLDSFRQYHAESAWTWERMALTRARVVAGPQPLVSDIEAIIRNVLTCPRDEAVLRTDVADMRGRMAREHPGNSIWDIKHRPGGLVDIEFIAQYLQLRHASVVPNVLNQNTREALIQLKSALCVDGSTADLLIDALTLWQTVQERLRLTLAGASNMAASDDEMTPMLRQALEGAAGLAFEALVQRMEAVAVAVRQVFVELVGTLPVDPMPTTNRKSFGPGVHGPGLR